MNLTCVARTRSNRKRKVRTEKVMAGLYLSKEGRMLMMLELMTSRNPNTDVMVVIKIKMNRRPAHNQPDENIKC